MLQISNLLFFALVILVLGTIVTIVVALLGIKSSIRRSKSWRIWLACLAGITVLQVPLLTSHREIEQSFRDLQVRLYTSHLRSPATYEGISFPAGSTVIRDYDDPHPVMGGTVPAGTTLFGLKIDGDFTISRTGDDGQTPYLAAGTLVAPATIHKVPCAKGGFSHTFDTSNTNEVVTCTLSTEGTIDGIPIPSGSEVVVTFNTYNGQIDASGDVKRAWRASGVDCAEGHFTYFSVLECPLTRDQVFDGYPVAAGHTASFKVDGKGSAVVYEGALSHDFDVAGVRIPAGSAFKTSYNGQYISADTLRTHTMDESQYVQFDLPAATSLTISGVVLQGEYVGLYVYNHSIKVHVVTPATDPDADADTAIRDGTFDLAKKTWSWEEEK
ncbi:hypothetical protein EC912_105223 [Luteibacter rhizovicinus]|uniref:Uncharacterized protein n=1 Tax=Luteibacter rhizovicinus TaxID=242606 RepID=A0A4R3YQX4_9GAMM|nr:hypothetical protein [Luteibacter rhizovicinus]TCV93363.1 hypothetical protein EC912_105223 [Luteibacter rhizovicinus]